MSIVDRDTSLGSEGRGDIRIGDNNDDQCFIVTLSAKETATKWACNMPTKLPAAAITSNARRVAETNISGKGSLVPYHVLYAHANYSLLLSLGCTRWLLLHVA